MFSIPKNSKQIHKLIIDVAKVAKMTKKSAKNITKPARFHYQTFFAKLPHFHKKQWFTISHSQATYYEVDMKKSLIRLSEVLKRTGYSKAWVYALMSRGQFPQSVKIGARAIAFIESEIDDWIDQRIAESRSN